MGKRIEDLGPLDDTPIAPAKATATDGHREPWCQVVSIIDGLLASGEYDWAFDSLDGIKQTIESTRRVTEGQQRAVANIERSRRGDRTGSRRYEGWRR